MMYADPSLWLCSFKIVRWEVPKNVPHLLVPWTVCQRTLLLGMLGGQDNDPHSRGLHLYCVPPPLYRGKLRFCRPVVQFCLVSVDLETNCWRQAVNALEYTAQYVHIGCNNRYVVHICEKMDIREFRKQGGMKGFVHKYKQRGGERTPLLNASRKFILIVLTLVRGSLIY